MVRLELELPAPGPWMLCEKCMSEPSAIAPQDVIAFGGAAEAVAAHRRATGHKEAHLVWRAGVSPALVVTAGQYVRTQPYLPGYEAWDLILEPVVAET